MNPFGTHASQSQHSDQANDDVGAHLAKKLKSPVYYGGACSTVVVIRTNHGMKGIWRYMVYGPIVSAFHYGAHLIGRERAALGTPSCAA